MVRPKRVAFRTRNGVGTRGLAFAARWLAYALPYRRFVAVLADANARLGADVDRYSFIVVDLHHLLLAGLPAHPCENSNARRARRNMLEKLRIMRAKSCCAHMARYRVGELYFPHFADV